MPRVRPKTSHAAHRARISVAPLRYGAGMKGKVGEALSSGTPTVVTSIAAEGLGLTDGADTFVADDAEAFAAAVARLYTDEVRWDTLRENGRRLVAERFGPGAMSDAVREMLHPLRRTGRPAAA